MNNKAWLRQDKRFRKNPALTVLEERSKYLQIWANNKNRIKDYRY